MVETGVVPIVVLSGRGRRRHLGVIKAQRQRVFFGDKPFIYKTVCKLGVYGVDAITSDAANVNCKWCIYQATRLTPVLMLKHNWQDTSRSGLLVFADYLEEQEEHEARNLVLVFVGAYL